MTFYDFTNVYLVNVNNALELANQSEHYIGLKHEPSDTINLHVCMYMIFMTENNRAIFSSFINMY